MGQNVRLTAERAGAPRLAALRPECTVVGASGCRFCLNAREGRGVMATTGQDGHSSRGGLADGCCGGSCLPPLVAMAWTIGGLILLVVREFTEPVCVDLLWTDNPSCITLGGALSGRVATWSVWWIAGIWLAGCAVLWGLVIARASRAR